MRGFPKQMGLILAFALLFSSLSFVLNSRAAAAEIQTVTFTRIESAEGFACGLTPGGGVKCWGYNQFGQLGDGSITDRSNPVDVVGLTSGVIDISPGMVSCALMDGGEVKCWGQIGYSISSIPVDIQGLPANIVDINGSNGNHCALTQEGLVWCWDSSSYLQPVEGVSSVTPVQVELPGNEVLEIAPGNGFVCALLDTTGVKCWGANNEGQLGIGSIEDQPYPVDVVGLSSGVSHIFAGPRHACALLLDGTAQCWGSNLFGQLGRGTTSIYEALPGLVSADPDEFTWLSVGEMYTCARTNTGGAKCWGDNYGGKLGDGTLVSQYIPTTVQGLPEPIRGISTGWSTCAVGESGKAYCWGNNFSGQLGNGALNQQHIPMDIATEENDVLMIDSGDYHTCLLTTAGVVKCFGMNVYGELGNGSNDSNGTPQEITGLPEPAVFVSAGSSFSCAGLENGGAYCWGINNAGQLGTDVTNNDSNIPVPVVGLSGSARQIHAGHGFTCALLQDNTLECWGVNNEGQLGDGTTSSRTTPAPVIGLPGEVLAFTTGGAHSCALVAGGDVYCWGMNSVGELGDGTYTSSPTPLKVPGLDSAAVAVGTGYSHTCAALQNGSLKCWGGNGNGQLGAGSGHENLPVDVPIPAAMAEVAGGAYSTCARTELGALYCWGGSRYGQVGDGEVENRYEPVPVVGLDENTSQVSMGEYHVCAIAAGRAKCWGYDGMGQLGLGNPFFQVTPVEVMEAIPYLVLGYPDGQPGSYFTVTGVNFPRLSTVRLIVNGTPRLEPIQARANGGFIIFINSSEAPEGVYEISAEILPEAGLKSSPVLANATSSLSLESIAQLRAKEGGGQIFLLMQENLFLPLLTRP